MLGHPKIDTPKYVIYGTYIDSLDSSVSGDSPHIYFVSSFT